LIRQPSGVRLLCHELDPRYGGFVSHHLMICLFVCFLETEPVIKTQHRYKTRYGKVPPSDNVIRRWLKRFKETGSVLHRKGVARPNISQEDVDRIQEACCRSLQKSNRRTSLQLDIP
jgi:hypothetical protein